MPERINFDTDDPMKIYKYLDAPFQSQIMYAAEIQRQAMLDWHGKVDWSLYDENEFHVSTKLLFRLFELTVARDWMEVVRKKPYLPFMAEKEEYQGICDAINQVITKDLDRCRYPMKMDMAIRQMVMGGSVALFPYFRVRKYKHPVELIEYDKKGNAKLKIVQDTRFDRGLDFKVIPAYSYGIDETVGAEWWRMRWAMWREYSSVEEVEELIATMGLKKNFEVMEEPRLDDVGHEILMQIRGDAGDPGRHVYIDHVLLRNRYIRILNGKHILQDEKYNPWIDDRVNLIILKNVLDPNISSVHGVALNTIVGSSAFNYDVSFNALLNMLMQRRNMIMTYNEDAGIEPEDLVAGSMGARLPRGSNPDDITIQQLPDVSRDFWNLPNMLKGETHDIAGIQEYEMGAPPSPVQQPTTMQLVERGTSAKLAYRFATVYEEPLSWLALHLAVIAGKYKSSQELMDDLGNDIVNLIVDPRNPEAQLDPRMISGGYYMGFEASAKVAERQEKLGSLEKAYNLTANNPYLSALTHLAILETYYRALPGLDKHTVDKWMAPTYQQIQSMGGIPPGGQPVEPAQSVMGNFGQVVGKPGQPVSPFQYQK